VTQPPPNPFGDNPFGDSPFGAPAPFGAAPPTYTAHPPPAGRGAEANTLATLSVIFAFVFAPAGAVLGHLGLSQIARTGQRGRDRALVGLSLSYVIITAAVVSLVVWAATGTSGQHTHPQAGGAASPGQVVPFTPAPVAPLGSLRPPRDLRENAFDHKPDAPRWTYAHPGSVALAGGDSRIVVTAAEDGIMALDASSGNRLWHKPYQPAGFSTDRFWLAGPNDCQLDRADTTIGCMIHDATAKKGIVFFLDVATGAQRGSTTDLDGSSDNYLQRSGDNFVVGLGNGELRGYRADGTLAWQADAHLDYGGYTNYPDQGVILPRSSRAADVYDAATGKPLVHLSEGADNSVAFAAGFAVNDGNRHIVFYDFTGRQTAAIPSDGFRLLDDILTGEPHFGDSEPSSGVYQPLAYNDTTHELRAFDGATGRPLWTSPVANPDQYMAISRVFGSDTTCFLTHGHQGNEIAVKVQACDQPSYNPFLPGVQQLGWLGGFDGQRVMIITSVDRTTNHPTVACLDIATGQQLWDTTFDALPEWIGAATYVKAHTYGLHDETLLQRWA
jgi:outer membrane protein assembly factor BamB